MLRTIRKSIWETNSSSSHSLVIERNEFFNNVQNKDRTAEVSRLKQEMKERIEALNGILTVYLGEYDWDFEILESFDGKLSYIISDILSCMFYEGHEVEKAIESLRKAGFLENFEKELGVTKIRFLNLGNCSVDHQSLGLVPGTLECGYDDPKIIDFLVDDSIKVLITNDNSPQYCLNTLVHLNSYNLNGNYSEEDVVTFENAPDYMKED